MGAIFSALSAAVMALSVRGYDDLEQDMSSVERTAAYSCAPSEAYIGWDIALAWPLEGTLGIRNLAVGHAPHLAPVLGGITFSVASNERVGVVGRTGAGKFSLIFALFRFCLISVTIWKKIDERLQSLNQRAATYDREGSDLKDTTEEKESTEQCLRICQQVSEFIERSQERLSQNEYGSGHMPSRPETRGTLPHNAEIATKAILSDLRSRFSENSTALKVRLTELNKKLRAYGG